MKWNVLSKEDKIKKISKYVVNTLNMINMLLLGLARIWNWEITNISATIIVVAGVISLYLVGGKLWNMEENDEQSNDVN